MYKPGPQYPDNWNRLRHYIFKRDHYICQICGRKCDSLTKSRRPHCHHIIPISEGGSSHPSNLITVCERCHKLIHNKL